ncbi:P-loop NTPase, partial [Blautia sp. CAG:237]
MAECSNSGSCGKSSCEGCASKGQSNPQNFMAEQNIFSDVKHVIGVVSGKGGVGKSFVTGSLANAMAAKGYKVGILDADITGPSIPKMYGLTGAAQADDNGIYPMETANGIKVMSINLLLPTEDTPVIWRGPVLANMVKQFWTDVVWDQIDYLFVDMPPGTGDVPLTVFQSLP